MEHYDDSFFTETTDLPSSSDGQSQAVAPTTIEVPENLEGLDFTSYLNDPLNQGELSAPADKYAELLNRNFNPTINYDDDYTAESSGAYIDPAVIFSSSGPGEQPASLITTATDLALLGAQPLISPSIEPGKQQAPPIVTSIDPVSLGAQQERDGRYRNEILNSFISPVVPLRVIDEVNYPFEQGLLVALGRELVRELDRELLEALQGPTGPPAPTPMQPSRPRAPMKKAGNKRPENIRNFKASDFYEPLQSRPASWGSINPETGDQLFQYTEHGELNPLHSFSVEQISEYFSTHPLHKAFGSHNAKISGLTFWIQTVPADSGRRYPDKQSDKCRFACCPDPHRTIRKGEFRVAFDEQNFLGQNTDPFHCAGYVHLYCLEKFFDFPQISKAFNVRPDTRVFREGKNKMAITRDHSSMESKVWEFIAESVPWAQFGNGRRPTDYYEFTLSSKLTAEHLDKQSRRIQDIRTQRGGNSIDIHKNNLDLRVENAKILRENRTARLQAEPKLKLPKKRKADNLDGEESVFDEQILNEVETGGSASSSPPPKRRRSPRRSRSPEANSRTDGFHDPRLRF